ncbi:MAG: heavy-metal-associated domain-containing protein [Deltaproteobacteria bacterium]|nr:heavy-metal-associated domain-containing protein [Deltaproteobacteria bacterium]
MSLWAATFFALVFAAFSNYFGALISPSTTAASNQASANTQIYDVEGMTCESCTVHITEALQSLQGASAQVSYAEKTATVSPAAVVAAIADVGYRAVPQGWQVHRFDVEGLHKDATDEAQDEQHAKALSVQLAALSRVQSASVSLQEHTVFLVLAKTVVAFDDDKVLEVFRQGGLQGELTRRSFDTAIDDKSPKK